MTSPVQRTGVLRRYGWDDAYEQVFASTAPGGAYPARVVRADLNGCVVVHEGGEDHRAYAPQLRTRGESVTTGDFVAVSGDEVVAVLERRTSVVRSVPRRDARPQVLAANVEFVLVAEPLSDRFRPRRIERLLVVAWASGALPIVVLTKADRCGDVESVLHDVSRLAPGAAVHAVSAVSGEGMEALAAELAPATTSVVIGRSGAGKSTLATALAGKAVELETTPVRRDEKGRHTTVTRELVVLSNGALLIDTPGLRSIGLAGDEGAVSETFSELEALGQECRFSDCQHRTEPGCAVSEAIGRGELEPSRLESYRRLQREEERFASRDDARLRQAREARWRRLHKEAGPPRLR